MNIQHLVYFSEVYRQRSINLASQNLYISPPSLSVAIKKLEEELGVKLFEHSRMNFRPTREGDNFYKIVSSFLTDLYMFQNARNMTSECLEIKIAVYKSLSEEIIQKIYETLSEQFPFYIFNIFTFSPNKTINDLIVEQDASIIITIDPFGDTNAIRVKNNLPDNFVLKRIGKLYTYLVCSKSNSLSNSGRPSFSEISNYPFVFLSARTDSEGTKNFLSIFSTNKINVLFVETNQILYKLLLEKNYLTIISDYKDFFSIPSESQLCYIPIEDDSLTRYCYIAYTSPECEVFYTTILNCILF